MILFGEHAVVYGIPAIATSIDANTELTLCIGEAHDDKNFAISITFQDFGDTTVNIQKCDLDAACTGLEKKTSQSVHAICLSRSEKLLQSLNPSKELIRSVAVILLTYAFARLTSEDKCDAEVPIRLQVSSQLPIGAGLGSSAAYCSVLAACFLYLTGFIKENVITPDQLLRIQMIAHEAEKIMHTNPSGVDTSISAYGGIVMFKRNLAEGTTSLKRLCEPFSESAPPKLLIINTLIPRSTADAVNSVRKFRDSEPDKCIPIFDKISEICTRASDILSRPLDTTSFEKLSWLFDTNHEALCSLGVSHEKLDEIVKRLKNLGLSAKLTGAGCGGCAVALVGPNFVANDFSIVEASLKDLNVTVMETKFCVPGLQITFDENENCK